MDHITPPPDSHPPTPPPPAESVPPPAPEPRTAKARGPIRTNSPVRLLLVVVVVFVGLLLVMRTLAVAPFGVPTGSMAPALIGHHREGPCPRCGFPVRVGRPSSCSATEHFPDLECRDCTEHFSHVACPNCDYRFSLAGTRDLNGDRLLVDKNVYSLRTPRRWEMVVFQCPDTNPKEFGKPYVKRLIGLPGETVTLLDGDVYANGQIARKELAEVRETMIPVFDMRYTPKPDGWGDRWVVAPADPRLPVAAPTPVGEPPAGSPPTTGRGATSGEPVVQGTELVLDASGSPQTMVGVTYRNWNLDDRKEEPIRAWSAYDGAPRRSFGPFPAAHDFVLTCEVEVTAATTTTGEARFACRLMDGADAVAAELAVGAKGTGQTQLVREQHGGLGTAAGVALEPGHRYPLEFAFVDRQVLLALDGKLVLPAAELEAVTRRDDVRRPLQIGARGCRVVVRALRLFRDIHYTQFGEHGTRHPAVLGPKEYFVLGDNSGNSQDSRKWPTPGVPEADFIGKPFLIHQPLRPAHTTVGGREREFQTLDWARLRWLH